MLEPAAGGIRGNTSAEGIPAGIDLYDPMQTVVYMSTDQHNVVVAYRVK